MDNDFGYHLFCFGLLLTSYEGIRRSFWPLIAPYT